MKKILLLITLFALVSCEKDIEPTPLTQAEQEQVNSLLVGTWEDAGYIYDGDGNKEFYPQCTFTEEFVFVEIMRKRNDPSYEYIVYHNLNYTIVKLGDNSYMLHFSKKGWDKRIKTKGDNILLSPLASDRSSGSYYNLSRITP